ncbi:hypothetical protein [Xanthomonas sp. MUS 060]|nr:hypothetical protein [Xanthomonas sp. MUS 060]
MNIAKPTQIRAMRWREHTATHSSHHTNPKRSILQQQATEAQKYCAIY